MEFKILIDDFRFVDNLHTTARQLPVFTELIYLLNNKQLHKRILEGLIEDWSNKEEIENEKYKLSKGKVTNQNKRTIALRYHLEVSSSIGLVVKHNDLYINSKISKLFVQLLKDSSLGKKRKDLEFVFYTFQLLTVDADGIILCLSQLSDVQQKTQTELQGDFKRALNERLKAKQDIENKIIKNKISERYKSINYIWKKPEKYAEHLIAPRYEWLSYLGLVNIQRESKKTFYSLTNIGVTFVDSLPVIAAIQTLKDVNNSWLNSTLFSFINSLLKVKKTNFRNLNLLEQKEIIGESLERAMKMVHSSMSFKLPLKETLLFICIDLFVRKEVVINFDEVKMKLKSDFSYNKKSYLLKESARANEGYITITTVK